MFTNEDRQKQRTGKYGTSRDQYLQDLVTQFQKTTSEEFKEQIVAHLANFSYDPFNYDHFRKLHILDLFLDCLTEPNAKLVEFALGGICNCCPDRPSKCCYNCTKWRYSTNCILPYEPSREYGIVSHCSFVLPLYSLYQERDVNN